MLHVCYALHVEGKTNVGDNYFQFGSKRVKLTVRLTSVQLLREHVKPWVPSKLDSKGGFQLEFNYQKTKHSWQLTISSQGYISSIYWQLTAFWLFGVLYHLESGGHFDIWPPFWILPQGFELSVDLNQPTISESSRYLAGISWDKTCTKRSREGLVFCKRLSEVYSKKITLVNSTEPMRMNLDHLPTYSSLKSSERMIRKERRPATTDQLHCPANNVLLLLAKRLTMKLFITRPIVCVCINVYD